jgi:hypothetical protein
MELKPIIVYREFKKKLLKNILKPTFGLLTLPY